MQPRLYSPQTRITQVILDAIGIEPQKHLRRLITYQYSLQHWVDSHKYVPQTGFGNYICYRIRWNIYLSWMFPQWPSNCYGFLCNISSGSTKIDSSQANKTSMYPKCAEYRSKQINKSIHSYLLLLISMLWHRQAIFKSKGDKLCSSAESRIWTRDPRHQIASRLNARWQTDWAIEDQAKNLNSTARPYDQRAFSPLDPTVIWLSHLALAIYIFVVVNFDALAQASDIQIERRQVAESRIWTRNPRHQIASRLNARWQTDWAIEDQAKNLNSTARPYDQRAFSPLDPTVSWFSHLALAIYIFVVVNFDALAQASDIQIERRQVVFLCWKQDLNPGSQTPNRQQTECSLTNRLSYRWSS